MMQRLMNNWPCQEQQQTRVGESLAVAGTYSKMLAQCMLSANHREVRNGISVTLPHRANGVMAA